MHRYCEIYAVIKKSELNLYYVLKCKHLRCIDNLKKKEITGQ